MKSRINYVFTYWLPVVVWMAVIFKLSSGSVPSASPVYWQDFVFKKSAHMFFYGVLAILFYRALVATGVKKDKALIWAVVYAILYGMTDEYHQSFTQGREARIRDIGFDGVGATVFALITKWGEKYL